MIFYGHPQSFPGNVRLVTRVSLRVRSFGREVTFPTAPRSKWGLGETLTLEVPGVIHPQTQPRKVKALLL